MSCQAPHPLTETGARQVEVGRASETNETRLSHASPFFILEDALD
jgi:hypothetical protein